MAIRKIPKETNVYHFYNANPANRRTADCVIRAMSLATGKTWEQCLMGLAVTGCRVKAEPASKDCYDAFLQEIGWKKMPQPRKPNGTKYTVKEFCQTLAEKNVSYFVAVANHAVCVKDCKAWDIWDCTSYIVCNYWVKG